MSNHYRRTHKELSQRSEKRAATELGGKVQIASGAISGLKGDVVTDEFLVEDKITRSSTQVTLKKAWLDKIKREAFMAGRTPLLRLTFGDEGEAYYVLRSRDFTDLLERE